MQKGFTKTLYNNIPIFWFTEGFNQEGDALLDAHLDASAGIIQFDTLVLSKWHVMKYINQILRKGFTILFVHVYPAKMNTISIYVKEDFDAS